MRRIVGTGVGRIVRASGSGIARSAGVTRRVVAFIGIVVLLALAATLLWQVYMHHSEGDPFEREEPASVWMDGTGQTGSKICGRNELSYSPSGTRECGTRGAISVARRSKIT